MNQKSLKNLFRKLKKKRRVLLTIAVFAILTTVYQNCGTKSAPYSNQQSSVGNGWPSSTPYVSPTPYTSITPVPTYTSGITFPTGITTLKSTLSSKCIGLPSGGRGHADNPSVVESDCVAGATNQFWTITSLGSNVFTLNALSKCMTSTGYSNGNPVQNFACDSSTSQQWQAIAVGSGRTIHYEFQSVDSGKCLDVTGGSTANGTLMQQWDCGSTNTHQQFDIAQVRMTSHILYREVSTNGMHMSTANSGEAGWHVEGPLVKLYDYAYDSSMVVLYRCYIGSNGSHFATTDPGCEGMSGAVRDNITLGYVHATQQDGEIPLYRQWYFRNGDFMESTDYLEGDTVGYYSTGTTAYVLPYP